jgi:hypothetical protein
MFAYGSSDWSADDGGYAYSWDDFDEDLQFVADHHFVWEDSDGEDAYLHSHPVDDSDDEADSIVQADPEHLAASDLTAVADGIKAPASSAAVVSAAGVVTSSQPPAPTFVNAFPNHELKPTHFEDLSIADSTNVGFTAPSKWKAASTRKDRVPIDRDRPAGSPDFYGATFIAIVPVGLSPAISTFGSCGLVRGRLRSLRR